MSPRVVLTNAHCVRGCPLGSGCASEANLRAALAQSVVVFSPVDGSTSVGAPPSLTVGVIDVIAHPDSHVTAFDGGPTCSGGSTSCVLSSGCPNWDRDLAVLILDQRVDHRTSGLGTQDYPAIPARIRIDDPILLGIGPDPAAWDGTLVDHVGYGPIDRPGGTLPGLRQIRGQRILRGNQTVCGWSSSIQLGDTHGLPGDSGGGVFSDRRTDRPMQILGVFTGTYSDGATYDHAVRLTATSVRDFLQEFLGTRRASYPGTDYRPSHSTGGTVWTGPSDCPPATEPTARAEWVDPLGRGSAAILDPDGDGMIGAHDNCWGIPNQDQRASDPTTLRASCIANGVTQTYGCMRETSGTPGVLEASLDGDNDGVPFGCDNCPYRWNDQSDVDRDGIGDACDGVDLDGDGLLENDNCPFRRNPDQANCNEDAEATVRPAIFDPASDHFGLGDACDDVPCGDTRISVATIAGTSVIDRIAVAPHDTRDGNYETGFRVCPCSRRLTDTRTSRRQCLAPIVVVDSSANPPLVRDGSGGCVINDIARFDATVEPQTWRWPTIVTRTGPSLHGTFSLRYSFSDYGGFAQSFETETLLGADALRWQSAFAGAYPGAGPSGVDLATTTFGTVFWTHVPSPGPSSTQTADQRRALTSHYWSGQVAGSTLVGPLFLGPEAELGFPAPFDGLVCATCAASFPAAFLLPRLSAGGTPAQLTFADGSAPAIDFGASMSAFDAPQVERWLVSSDHPAAETPEGLRAVGLASGGTQLSALLAQHGGVLIDELDAGCQHKLCDATSVPHETLLPTQPPPPRADFAAAMSGRARRLWIAGGVDSNGSPLGDLWELDLAQRTWRELEVGQTGDLGRIHAVAWSSATQVLYVLDEVRARHARFLRLVEVDPSGSAAYVQRRFPLEHDARYDLAVGPAGDAWIVSSDDSREHRGSTFTASRFVPRSASRRHPTATRWVATHRVSRSGRVPRGAIRASERGLSVLMIDRHGARSVAISLGDRSCCPSDGEDCREVERWF